MLFEKIKSPGLAHNSYLIGDDGKAAVIDPRRDVEVYLDKSSAEGFTIDYVLETHRNEDYLIGSKEIARKTGAEIWRADDYLDYEYGQPMEEGEEIEIGRLLLEGLHTPGHTPGSFSYVLYGYEGEPWMVFTGDVLFAGDVGRVDFLGEEKLEETAGDLYDSIYDKILPLGDEVILCPAHGAGSVCASAIADREWTTIGIEKNLNPHLQYESREEFIEEVGQMLEYPPYFNRMEEWNLTGAPFLSEKKRPEALSPDEFADIQDEGAVVIDTRTEVSFAGAHIPGSLSIWKDNVPSFAGWFVDTDSPILLVSDEGYPEEEIKHLYRTGFDNIKGYLSGGMISWHMQARSSETIETIRVKELCEIMKGPKDCRILDVRSEDEVEEEGEIEDAINIHITQLPDHYEEIPENVKVYVFCGSGLRAMTAASLLKREGFENIGVTLGGLTGWRSSTCPRGETRSSKERGLEIADSLWLG
ncbi:MBL fold metallo-hydrolase [Halarsenatibacter silvermanii]|uniref:Hydroxyacylglutathione hydrolase n=1 Tax=Halarsenatibacter silvermanii TaxID=321763 RepID=A0A1G9PVB8_9FIRM|nr:rhodanese-like domain-containing protein [Halarsenatibacter silvermanii]SDM02716.1 hydroxyacylglutathione hydrolase [Halarsenatibacter silvermanii]